MRKGGRGGLSSYDGAGKYSSASNHVFTKQFRHNEDEIADVDLRGDGGKEGEKGEE